MHVSLDQVISDTMMTINFGWTHNVECMHGVDDGPGCYRTYVAMTIAAMTIDQRCQGWRCLGFDGRSKMIPLVLGA